MVSPSSLRSWFEHFVTLGDDDLVEWLGEDRTLDPATVSRLFTHHDACDVAVLHSSHHTLMRDVTLSERLSRICPRPIIRQTAKAALLGTDKFAMKREFDARSLPSIPWRHRDDGVTPAQFAARHGGPFVVKLRNGTEGRALRLHSRPHVDLSDSEFEEPFVDGTEYSVIVLRVAGEHLTLPTIWKGPTRRDLLPPYQRLRLCPAPDLTSDEDSELRALSVTAAEIMDSDGFAEVELIVDAYGRQRVIEVNPRIAGTMRMAALASDLRIFDLPLRSDLRGHVEAERCVVEMPYTGSPWSDPERLVYCTSRMTVAAASWAELPPQVDRALSDSSAVPLEWQRSLGVALKELCATR